MRHLPVSTPRESFVIPFVKASACGNDFLLIDGELAPADLEDFTRRICDRHEGVGADGVEWMFPHSAADMEIRLINADGSAAEISGNGTRCVAAYLCAQQGKERITVQTGAGLKTCTLTSRQDDEYEFEIEIGEAVVEKEHAIKLAAAEVRGIAVSMGNPHFVIFSSKVPENWQSQAAEIQRSSAFKKGVNVEFVTIAGRHDVNALFYERGAGETRSSGTGSCASAAAAIATGWTESPVRVHAAGGTQTVRKHGDQIFLRGTARLICRGECFT
jgi:diaminopimelate epimerase